MAEKPPLGIRPKYIWVLERVREIQEALLRYHEENKDYPDEWIIELVEHTRYLRSKEITVNTHGSDYLERIQNVIEAGNHVRT